MSRVPAPVFPRADEQNFTAVAKKRRAHETTTFTKIFTRADRNVLRRGLLALNTLLTAKPGTKKTSLPINISSVSFPVRLLVRPRVSVVRKQSKQCTPVDCGWRGIFVYFINGDKNEKANRE